jgi:hypothetical protein
MRLPKEVKREVERLWSEAQAAATKRLGFPLASTAKERALKVVEDYDLDGDPEEQGDFLERFEGRLCDYIDFLAEQFPHKSAPVGKQTQGKSRGPYRGPFERRFQLVSFVISHWERDGRSYIRWKDIVKAWNKANPASPIVPAGKTRAEDTLKREYLRALKEPGIAGQILATRDFENKATYQQFVKRLRRSYKPDPATLRTGEGAWFHLVMTRDDDRPFREWTVRTSKGHTYKKITDIGEAKDYIRAHPGSGITVAEKEKGAE